MLDVGTRYRMRREIELTLFPLPKIGVSPHMVDLGPT